MKFTPELTFTGGRLTPLSLAHSDDLWALYQHPELPGQSVPTNPEYMTRIIDYSIKAAATQRGMMWLIEIDTANGAHMQGVVNAFDWQPSALRLIMRVDALASLSIEHRQAALQAAMAFLAEKYHVNNFAYQWMVGQAPDIQQMLHRLGFKLAATFREAWHIGNEQFVDMEQYHWLTGQAKPIAGRLGEQDNPGQNLEKSFGQEPL